MLMSLLPPHWLPAGGFFSRGCHPCLGLVTISFIFRCHVYGESPKRLWLFLICCPSSLASGGSPEPDGWTAVRGRQRCCRHLHLRSHLCRAAAALSCQRAVCGPHSETRATADVVTVSSSCSETMTHGFIRPPENAHEFKPEPEWCY